MSKQGKVHEEISEEVIEALQREGFEKEEIHLSHRCGDIEWDDPGRVALYRLNDDLEDKKGWANKMKEPDITAIRGETQLFVEIETNNSPKVSVGDLFCIDASTHVCLRSKHKPMPIGSCLAMVVLDDFKPNSKKEEQLARLSCGLRFCGSVKRFEICKRSDVSHALGRLLRGDVGIVPESSKRGSKENLSEEEKVRTVESILEYEFNDKSLAFRALTHRTFVSDHKHDLPGLKDQLPMATLGDALLRAVLTEALYKSGDLGEDEISIERVDRERNDYLRIVGKKLEMGDVLIAGRGGTKDGVAEGAALPHIIEALIAAIYLDCGYARSREVTWRLFNKADSL